MDEISLMLVQCQADLERLDGGASAYIYAVNDQVVLKSPVTFVLPKADSSLDQYEYALHTVCYYEDIQNERAILRQLERIPHPNIIQPITLEHPEGIYLRRYFPLSRRLKSEKPPQFIRFSWYRDMLRALVHLHKLEIAHADIRLDNFLCHSEGTIVLCDFTCSKRFGQDNPSATGSSEILGVNGFSTVVSDITDRFALASVMFEIETGSKPAFAVLDDSIHFPAVKTGSESLDLIIERAWCEKYESTIDMLRDIKALLGPSDIAAGSIFHPAVIESLQAEITEWRRIRAQKYGKSSFWTGYHHLTLTDTSA